MGRKVNDMSYIELRNVSKTIKKNPVLKNVTLELEQHKIYGIQGVNGSGKTMLLRAISGLMRTEGEIRIQGRDPVTKGQPLDIGVMIELPGFLREFTGKENLKLLALIQKGITEQDIVWALRSVGLDETDNRRYGKYSLGMKQRLGIAQAILGVPQLILLDEPTNAIDAGGVQQIKELVTDLKKQGSTLILTSHDRMFLEDLADEVITMEGGRVICRQ